MSSQVAVVILAGGEGRRMGGNKPLQILAGERLIDRALRQASRWSDLVAISVRNTEQLGGTGALLVYDEAVASGPLAGLISALRFAQGHGCDLVLTIPADAPFLPANLLARLRGAIGQQACALAKSGGNLHPVCALWRTNTLPNVADYLGTERRSLKGFAEKVGLVTVEWRAEPIDPFFNINSPADLAEAKRLLQKSRT